MIGLNVNVTASSSVQIQITWHTMQFSIQSSKLGLTVKPSFRVENYLQNLGFKKKNALRRRMSYLQPFLQFHLGFSNA